MKLTLMSLCLIASLSLAQKVSQPSAPKLHLVQQIYVGEMGTSDEAARFRLLLEDALTKKGFVVTTKPEGADAVLTGVLTVRVYADESLARATVRLRSSSGEVLWSGDFQPKLGLRGSSDTVTRRAQNIADKLREDWKKSAKSAGVKVK